MNHSLFLTSPNMTGEDVKRAQYVLNGHNAFKQDYYQGEKIDGVYGAMTAQAAFRAHYWAGFSLYDLEHFGHVYGEVLDGILSGKITPNDAQKKARNERIHKLHAAPTLRQKAFARFMSHLGESEHGGMSYANHWYGMAGAWCAMAVTEAYVFAGSHAFVKGSRYAWCPAIASDAMTGRNNLSLTRVPQTGDGTLYDWDNDGEADHVNLFEKWESPGVSFWTVGGNESDRVQHQIHYVSDIALHYKGAPMFFHVGA